MENMTYTTQSFYSQDCTSNSPQCLPKNSENVSLENFALDQQIILQLTFFFNLVTWSFMGVAGLMNL